MKAHTQRLIAYMLLVVLSLVMFGTLFYYAIHGWGLRLQDARLVAVQETNLFILGLELVILSSIITWASILLIETIVKRKHVKKGKRRDAK